MTRLRGAFGVLVAVILAASTGAARAGGDAAVIPFEKGTTWTYAGTLRWTDPPNTIRTDDVRWVSEVVGAFDDGDVAAALLSGGVWDVAWWSRAKPPGSYALVRVGTRYYIVPENAKATFAALKQSRRKALNADLQNRVWFGTPLSQGQLYRAPDIAPRDSTLYAWSVDSAAPVNLAVPGVTRRTRREYVLTYGTLAGAEHVTVVPGIGITAFSYHHYGTVADARLHLVAFRRAPFDHHASATPR